MDSRRWATPITILPRGASLERRTGLWIQLQLEMVRADFHAAIEDAKAGDGANDAIELEVGDLIAFFLLLENAGAAKSTALTWGRNSRITDEQRSISSGLVARAILQ